MMPYSPKGPLRNLFHVKWNLGDTTVEPYNTCKELTALDRYLELQGVSDWKKLPRIDPVKDRCAHEHNN